jgi:hypothetical protein
MPMTVNHSPRDDSWPYLMRCPIGFPPGQNIRAIVSLMITTRGAAAVSRSSKNLPARSGT